MKRTTAFVMALAMMLTLAACGGKNADQPSNNTPPATQNEPSTQPDSNPADNSQPSEPTDTTTDEPQNNAGALPEGGFYLYDGVHYLSELYDGVTLNSTVISGEKLTNAVHKMSVEQAESLSGRVCGSMSFILGQNEEPFDYQISFADEYYAEYNGTGRTIAPKATDAFSVADAFAWVANFSDKEKTIVDCPIFCFTVEGIEDDDRKELLDGQSIVKFDDLLNILGTPTAAYSMGGPVTYYIWQFEDFIYTAWLQNLVEEEKFDETRQVPYFVIDWDNATVYGLAYYALNYNLDEINLKQDLEPWATTWPVQALTDLGLL